jgi:3-oxoacyl-[acyl-carrier protein] reductase
MKQSHAYLTIVSGITVFNIEEAPMASSGSNNLLAGNVAIVTGGGQGIGQAFSLGLAKEGCKVVVADVNLENAQKTVQLINDMSSEAVAVKTDVSNVEQTQQMARTAIDRFGHIDVLINNAALVSRGNLSRTRFHELSVDEWDQVMSVNLKGVFLCCRAVVPYMQAQNKGKIINMTSTQFFHPMMTYAHYITSKGGVIGLSRALAMELGDYNINVNCIAPGAVISQTAQTDGQLESRQQAANRQAIKRIQVADDVVGTALFLASSASDFMTGQTLVVDGGFVMR